MNRDLVRLKALGFGQTPPVAPAPADQSTSTLGWGVIALLAGIGGTLVVQSLIKQDAKSARRYGQSRIAA